MTKSQMSLSDEFLHEGLALFGLAGSTQQLIFPDDAGEPQLSIQDMIQLDSLADRVEIERLTKLGVLPPDSLQCEPGQRPKTLSTRFVRTWREKVIDNKRVFLRRSRYVAREFASAGLVQSSQQQRDKSPISYFVSDA